MSTLRGGGSLPCVEGAGRVIPQPLHQPPAAAIPHAEEVNLSGKGRAAALRPAKICAENCFLMQGAASRDVLPLHVHLWCISGDPAHASPRVWVKMTFLTFLNELVEVGFFLFFSQAGRET